MFTRILLIFTTVILTAFSIRAQAPLPLRSIVLFKNGMAQIVRTGELQEATSLSFHSQDMNDILKSFVAWNPQSLNLYSTGYSSAIPASTLLGRYDFDLRNPDLTLVQFIKQFRGRILRITDDTGTRRGRIVAIERKERLEDGIRQTDDHLTLVSDDHEIETFWISELQGIRFEDPGLNDQVSAYLTVLSEGSGESLRQITVYPIPSGGPIRIAYVQQFPVWKTSYRLELEGKPRIQGWALIDNPTAEPWDAVDLTLVSGLPTSFQMALYPPVLRERPTLPLPLGELAPPIQAQAEFGVLGGAAKGVSAPSLSEVTVTSLDASLPLNGRNRFELDAILPGGAALQFPEPESVETQDYFEYHFASPITLQAGQSALLPFINKPLSLRRISLYQAATSKVHPSLAAIIENTTGNPLEPGPVTVLENGRYAGEGILSQLPREEEAIITYGTDYELEVFGEIKTGESKRSRVAIDSGVATVTSEVAETTTYQVRNKGLEAKHLIVEHPRRSGRRLDAGEDVRMTRDYYRFGLDLAVGRSRELPVREILFWEESISIEDLDENSLRIYFSGSRIPDRVRSQLRGILERRAGVSEFEDRQESLEERIGELFEDQERVRKNLQALGRSDEEKSLRDLYVRQFATQESQLGELREELKSLEMKVRLAEEELQKEILAIQWEGQVG